MLHKPALLGILGAIIGLSGYRKLKVFPEYYIKLKDLPVGIQPLNANKGNFTKTVLHYKNGVGYASYEPGGNLIVAEQILIEPSYRCYLLLDTQNHIHDKLDIYLQKYQAEYLPYLGKNEFSIWWESYREYNYELFGYADNYKVATIFRKAETLVKEMREQTSEMPFLFESTVAEPEYLYFEELPIGFDENLMQYRREMFAYTNFILRKEKQLENLYFLKKDDIIVQLF
jgi:CRISPR-associated protein Cas5h